MKKVTIVGAGGNVGASVAQWLAPRNLAALTLIDMNAARAQGRFEDFLQSQTESNTSSRFQYGSDLTQYEDQDIVIITAGLPRKPGQSREELIAQNATIIKDISEKIARSSPRAIIIVVSNPLDAMTRVAQTASQFPPERIIGSAGCLDSARFKYQIAQHLNTDFQGIQAIVLGAHTDTHMVPIASQASLNGIPLTQLADATTIQSIIDATKKGGATLTERIGTSAWMAPGAATGMMVEAILNNSQRILPCSVWNQNLYNLPALFIGLPTQLGQKGVERILELPLSEQENQQLQEAAQAIEKLCESL